METTCVQGLSLVRGSSSPTNVIPGLPDEVALMILARLPRALHGSLCRVCHAWRDALQSLAMTALRNSLHISEMWTVFFSDVENSITLYDPLLQHISSPIPYLWDPNGLVVLVGAVGTRVYFWREDCEDHSGDIRCFDITSMQWQVDSIPLWGKASIMDLASAVVDGNLWLVGGGADARAARRFDVKRRKWEMMPKMRERRVEAAAVVLHGRLHVIGGRGFGGNMIYSGEIWDTSVGEWICQPELWPGQLKFCRSSVAVVMDTLYAFKGERELVHYVSKSKIWASLGHLPLEEYPCSCGERSIPRLVGAGRELWVVIDCRKIGTTCTTKILSYVPATGSSPLLWRSVPITSSNKFPLGYVYVCGNVHV